MIGAPAAVVYGPEEDVDATLTACVATLEAEGVPTMLAWARSVRRQAASGPSCAAASIAR